LLLDPPAFFLRDARHDEKKYEHYPIDTSL
jgi:hypothetical protein